jgi:single-stranded-DNA-specific exonuclease
MQKHWTYKPLPEEGEVAELQQQLNVSHAMAVLLWQRGIYSFDAAKHFFRPSLNDLHDPFLMKDMDKAVERVITALDADEKILIYGDYDVDGTTAVAMVYGFLRKKHKHLLYYNPDRYTEGYGVSKQGIDFAKEQGVSLIISLDCGIKSADKVEYAQGLGIDFIVCDHHEPGDEIPGAVAVLDPKRKDCPYPYKELTGNGVGFKLLSALCQRRGWDWADLEEYLDLCMVSIASDIVPITGENRILAFYGLQKLNSSPRISLKALMNVAGVQGEMNIESVVFTIGPRINAAGRIRHARAAVELLLSEDEDEALELAYAIQKHNTERKGLDSRITEEALDLIKNDPWLNKEAWSTVLYKEDWHKGVIGIVASRCIENFYRPTIIFTKAGEDYAAGSARSVAGFDLYSAIEACSDHLIQFGGHMHAAGMTISIDKIGEFRKAFDEVVKAQLTEEQRIPVITVDLEVHLSELTPKFHKVMKQMSPFGPENMQPIFVSHNLRARTAQVLKEKHLKMEVEQGGLSFPAIGFGLAPEFYKEVVSGRPFSMAYSLEENHFRGNTTQQLFIRDIKLA